MAKALIQIYEQYMQSEEHEAADQSIYDGAREEAAAALKDALPEGTDPCEYEEIISAAMIGANKQGFLEGFKYASKIWAECMGNK
jgi:hypothetical protein